MYIDIIVCLLGGDSDVISPRQRFTGVKPDLRKDLSLGFGDYVQALIPRNKSFAGNNMEERTEGAIALYPTGNIGGWRFMKLKNGELVTRYHWTQLPLTIEVVDRFEFMTEVEFSGDYHSGLVEELESQEHESIESSTSSSNRIDPIVEENLPDPVQTVPRVVRSQSVIPNKNLNVEVEVNPVIQVPNTRTVSSSTRSGRNIRRPARFDDPDFETHFDNQLDVPGDHDNANNSEKVDMEASNLINEIVNRQESINDEVNESLEIMLAFVDHRHERAFNMSIKKAIEKWSDKAVTAIRDR